jgi:very-short-patch-repair endonuclease
MLRRPEVYRARKLRREMSLPEVPIWQRVKGGQTGLKFRKQHPIGDYVADFYCAQGHAVVEVDGAIHEQAAAVEHDARRDALLIGKGYRILRVTAADVLRDADAVVEGIVAFAANPLHHACGMVPLPASGEDLA